MKKIYTFTKNNLFVLIALVFFTTTISAQTTWNGSVWSNGVPDISKDAIFNADYISSASIAAKSVSVANNAQVTISSGHTLTVADNITITGVAKLIIENNASLLQTNPSAVNSGNINFKRNANPMVKYDYTYWSSPVANQTLLDFSPLTASDRYYSYNTTTNNWVTENPANVMQPGKGYAIMGPTTYTTTPQVFNGEFIGVPNNGVINSGVVAFVPALLNFNLLGNPYPSAIGVSNLITNTTLGTLYFWTHNTAISNNIFTSNDYAVRTKTTGTQASSGGPVPGAYVAAGQGFFATSSATGTIDFTNSMRVADNNSQFFKNAQSPLTDPEFYYIWFNMTNSGGVFKQIALGYEEGATDGYDFGTDAPAAPGPHINFYSLIGGNTFAIQGRAFPWNVYDQIPLGYSTTIVGPFNITLDHTNVFFDFQAIFLEDILLGVFHNLRTSPYTFNTAIGTFNSRFKIHYFNPSLSNDEHSADANSVIVISKNHTISVNSSGENIQKIQIYDMSGKMIYENNTVNENRYVITNLIAKNQALIIKMQLENNQTIVKKLVY